MNTAKEKDMTYIPHNPLTHEKAMQIVKDDCLERLPSEVNSDNDTNFDHDNGDEKAWYDREEARRPFLKFAYCNDKDGNVCGLTAIQKEPDDGGIQAYSKYNIYFWPLDEGESFRSVCEMSSADTNEKAEEIFEHYITCAQ